MLSHLYLRVKRRAESQFDRGKENVRALPTGAGEGKTESLWRQKACVTTELQSSPAEHANMRSFKKRC